MTGVQTCALPISLGGGMSGTQQPSVLAVRAPLLSTAPPQPPPPPSTEPQCGYCGKYRHTEDVCRKKQHEKKSRRGESSAARPVATLEQEVLTLFCRLNAVASSPSGTTARASGTRPPPPPSSGISSKWFLDSGASFHMTPDSSQLSSLSIVDPPPIIQTADGTSLLVVGRGVLSTSSFHVPTVSHVPQLTMQLMFVGQITDHGCRIILESDSCCVQDLRTGLLVGTGPRRHDSQHL